MGGASVRADVLASQKSGERTQRGHGVSKRALEAFFRKPEKDSVCDPRSAARVGVGRRVESVGRALCISSSVAPRGGLREARSTTPQIPQCTGAHVSNTDAERRREGEEEGSGIRKGAASPSAAHSTARARRERSRPSHTSREDGSGRRRFAASGGRLR